MFEGQERPQLSSSIASVYGCLKVGHVVLVLQHTCRVSLPFSPFVSSCINLMVLVVFIYPYSDALHVCHFFLARFLRLVLVNFRWDFVQLHISYCEYVKHAFELCCKWCKVLLRHLFSEFVISSLCQLGVYML